MRLFVMIITICLLLLNGMVQAQDDSTYPLTATVIVGEVTATAQASEPIERYTVQEVPAEPVTAQQADDAALNGSLIVAAAGLVGLVFVSVIVLRNSGSRKRKR